MLSNVTFASINTPNIYFLAPGGLFLAGQWHPGQGPALPLAGLWVGPSAKSPCLSSGATALTFQGWTYVSVYTPRLASSRNVTMT